MFLLMTLILARIYNHYILYILLNTLNMKQRLDDMTVIASMQPIYLLRTFPLFDNTRQTDRQTDILLTERKSIQTYLS